MQEVAVDDTSRGTGLRPVICIEVGEAWQCAEEEEVRDGQAEEWRPLQRLVLHTLLLYAVSGFLSVTDMIASAVCWDMNLKSPSGSSREKESGGWRDEEGEEGEAGLTNSIFRRFTACRYRWWRDCKDEREENGERELLEWCREKCLLPVTPVAAPLPVCLSMSTGAAGPRTLKPVDLATDTALLPSVSCSACQPGLSPSMPLCLPLWKSTTPPSSADRGRF
ncbi:hypothetical protein EYF80_009331 [Liparis tanakae]|uniref:Uncharacterized protein n=1 Tax=Liparis tanakae TaxID=230148 RepID=A0A4Z2IRB7_9TELE|nr:hypothetical protein EYF80_009331 [Liparis tanakae]